MSQGLLLHLNRVRVSPGLLISAAGTALTWKGRSCYTEQFSCVVISKTQLYED